MKKILFSAFILVALASCGNDDSSKPADGTTTTTENGGATGADNSGGTANTTTASGISVAEADAGLDLIAKSDCLTCHKVEGRIIGPSYSEVAEKYPVDSATITTLAQKRTERSKGQPPDARGC